MLNVFSFGMIFKKVLTRNEPFEDEKKKNVQPRIDRGERPKLPNTCPLFLAFFIQSCWDGDPKAYPTFSQICRIFLHAKNIVLGMTFYEGHDSIFSYTSLNGVIK
jgi:hypothetical protein